VDNLAGADRLAGCMGRVFRRVLTVALFLSVIPVPAAAAAACGPVTLADLAPVPVEEPSLVATEEVTPEVQPGEVQEEVVVEQPLPQPSCRPFVYKMLWPVLGGGAIGSTFGAERDGGARMHAGVDIFGPKMSPVVAVRDGVVHRVNTGPGAVCCSIAIRHHDGWSSWYMHLNNDSYGSDDNGGVGIRAGLSEGIEVRAGEVIGWFGDSGNAEGTTPHLHFELHRPGGTAIDPLASLRAGLRRPQPGLLDPSLRFDGPFYDDDGHPAESLFNLLASAGADLSCDDWGAAVCPDQLANQTDMATWIGSLTRLDPPARPEEATPELDNSSLVVSADPTPLPADPGCFAPSCLPPATLGETLAMLAWSVEQRAYQVMISALETNPPLIDLTLLPAPPPNPWEIDPIAAYTQLAQRGMIDLCPLLSQPFDTPITRSELARLVGRAFGYLPSFPCNIL
jgi:hypothetical protein